MRLFGRSRKPEPRPKLAPEQGWRISVYLSQGMELHPTPWSWSLWENGKKFTGGWSPDREAAIADAQFTKDRILEARVGTDLPRDVPAV